MPQASRLCTCELCGVVLPNEPHPVLSHVMSHAQRRPFATSVARPSAPANTDTAHDDEAAT